MKPDELRVGDRIRIVDMPGEGIPGYLLLPETKRVLQETHSKKKIGPHQQN